ncbi:hypothetical protein ACOSP7_027787 [Xanthoceras sorbifolium]|uniref:Terpene synthase metal-binding domain-containing protein n=1 Tax=Xanthoceras sorbifolium TaxID=99658 RepID=A0ABQ8HGY8_9ROSI|nr:hypothetical protein JRO89_XS11G0231700 [Xanthoceras sorbifolium]
MLSEEVVITPEYHTLFTLLSTLGRLLNDVRTHKKESGEGKITVVLLQMIDSAGGVISKEEAIEKIEGRGMDNARREGAIEIGFAARGKYSSQSLQGLVLEHE